MRVLTIVITLSLSLIACNIVASVLTNVVTLSNQVTANMMLGKVRP